MSFKAPGQSANGLGTAGQIPGRNIRSDELPPGVPSRGRLLAQGLQPMGRNDGEALPNRQWYPATSRRSIQGPDLAHGSSAPSPFPIWRSKAAGKRPLRFCNSVTGWPHRRRADRLSDAFDYARKFGRVETSGRHRRGCRPFAACSLLGADHKNVKRLIGSLQEKLAIEVVRPPDYRLAIPTRYRIFNSSQVLDRRRAAGLPGSSAPAAVSFVDLATVNRLITEQSLGEIPMDDPVQRAALIAHRHKPDQFRLSRRLFPRNSPVVCAT